MRTLIAPASGRRAAGGPPRALFAAAAVSAAAALVPLLYLVVRAGDAGWRRAADMLLRPRTLETVGTSVALVAVVATACLLIGVPTAWLVTRTDLPGRSAWLALLALPLAVPSYVAAYTWIAQFPAMSGFWAAAMLLTLVSFPYVALPVAAALRAADPAYEEVARALGRGPVRAFTTATLPRSGPPRPAVPCWWRCMCCRISAPSR